MEGTRRLVLYEPPATVTEDALGQETGTDDTEHVVYAIRNDRGGRHTVDADTLVGEWTARFKVRASGIKGVNPNWRLVDEYGQEYEIENVGEPDQPFLRHYYIYAKAVS